LPAPRSRRRRIVPTPTAVRLDRGVTSAGKVDDNESGHRRKNAKRTTTSWRGSLALEAAIALRSQLGKRGKSVEDIDELTVRTQKPAIQIIDKQGPLTNPADRDHFFLSN
jgi:hypothetical protein